MRLPKSVLRVLLLGGVLAVAMASSSCESYVGVGVAYGGPNSWGGTWPGSYPGAPVYFGP